MSDDWQEAELRYRSIGGAERRLMRRYLVLRGRLRQAFGPLEPAVFFILRMVGVIARPIDRAWNDRASPEGES